MSESIRPLVTRIMRDALQNPMRHFSLESSSVSLLDIHQDDVLGPVQSIIPILDLGMVNRVYRLICLDCELILRMRASPTALQEFCKEAWCLQQAKSIGIPSPEVRAVGMVDETSYLLETYISGTNGSLSPLQRITIWETLGWMARRIESIPATGFGLELDTESSSNPSSSSKACFCINAHPLSSIGRFRNSFTPTWETHVRYNLDAIGAMDPLPELGVYSSAQEERIRDAFSFLLTGMETGRLRLGLLHGDLSPRNIMVGTDGTLHLIDWGCALVHAVPHYGLACMLRSRLEDGSVTKADEVSFRTGYGLDIDGYAKMEMEKDVQRIALLDSFDKLRWALDKSPADIPALRAFAMRMVHEFVQGD